MNPIETTTSFDILCFLLASQPSIGMKEMVYLPVIDPVFTGPQWAAPFFHTRHSYISDSDWSRRDNLVQVPGDLEPTPSSCSNLFHLSGSLPDQCDLQLLTQRRDGAGIRCRCRCRRREGPAGTNGKDAGGGEGRGVEGRGG